MNAKTDRDIPSKEGSQSFYLIEDSPSKNGEAAKLKVLFGMIPDTIELNAPFIVNLNGQLLDNQGDVLHSAKTDLEYEGVASGNIAISYTPGGFLVTKSRAVFCAPFLMRNAFDLALEKTIKIQLDLSRDEAQKVADWNWAVDK